MEEETKGDQSDNCEQQSKRFSHKLKTDIIKPVVHERNLLSSFLSVSVHYPDSCKI